MRPAATDLTTNPLHEEDVIIGPLVETIPRDGKCFSTNSPEKASLGGDIPRYA